MSDVDPTHFIIANGRCLICNQKFNLDDLAFLDKSSHYIHQSCINNYHPNPVDSGYFYELMVRYPYRKKTDRKTTIYFLNGRRRGRRRRRY